MEEEESGRLNQRQMLFINHYITSGNATDAARKAGYSEDCAGSQGSRLLKNAKVLGEIDRINDDLVNDMKFREQSIISELWRIAKSNPQNVFNLDGGLLSIDQIPEDEVRTIKSIEVEELFEGRGDNRYQSGVIKKITFWDKTKAIELLGRVKGMFVEKIEMKIDDNHQSKMKRARERVDAARAREQARRDDNGVGEVQ